MPTIDEVIKMIYRLYRKKHNQAVTPCPDEETLVCFSEGRLSKSDSEKIEEHIASCQRCAQAVLLFCQGFKEEKQVPELLIKKVKDLVAGESVLDILELVLALKEKALQILNTTADVILGNEIIPPPLVRSRKLSEFPEEIKLIKEFKDVKVTIQVQKKEDKVRINLNLIDKASSLPLSDARLTLLKDTEEIESYDAVSGNASFDRVGFGRWVIQILRKGKKIGVINLEIK